MESKEGPIKWGILGLGKIARKMAQDLQLVEGVELQAVASRSEEKAQRFAKEFGARRSYGRYEDLCEDPQVDLVYIATPHSFHYPHAQLAIDAGKSVLVEKPLALNPEESHLLIEKARQKGVFLMEGIWTRFIPITEKLLELIKNKAIGEIKYVEADFGFKPKFDPQSRLFNPKLGGGSLLDIGIYPLYLAQLLLGSARSQRVEYRLSATGVDSYCLMDLQYDQGAKAKLWSSFEEQTPTEALIRGSAGSIKLHRRFHHSEGLSLSKTDGSVEEIHLPLKGLGYVHEIEEVKRCLQAGWQESPKLNWANSLALAESLAHVKSQIENH